MTADSGRYRARWIFPITAEPIRDGTVIVEEGRIAGIHDATDASADDLGDVAVIPGLVNAHTHLELSDIADPLAPPQPFSRWLRAVIAHRRSRPGDCEDAVRRGCRESGLAGTTLIGDITAADCRVEPTSPGEARIVAFLELIGLRSDRVDAQLELACAFLDGDAANATGGDLVRGISPHAPYSVHPDLYGKLVGLADERRVPLAVHLAETRSELELLQSQSGELFDFLCELGAWEAGVIEPGTRPLDYLRPLASLERSLVIHGNYLADDELAFLARCPNLTMVYCPRTHAYFRHHGHPWREVLAGGGSVALGTDSRASNPDLSLWRELLFLRGRHADVDGATLLKLVTLDGARALGQSGITGSLDVGKSADLAVVALPAAASGDAYNDLLAPSNRITAVMHRGHWIQCRND